MQARWLGRKGGEADPSKRHQGRGERSPQFQRGSSGPQAPRDPAAPRLHSGHAGGRGGRQGWRRRRRAADWREKRQRRRGPELPFPRGLVARTCGRLCLSAARVPGHYHQNESKCPRASGGGVSGPRRGAGWGSVHRPQLRRARSAEWAAPQVTARDVARAVGVGGRPLQSGARVPPGRPLPPP